MTTPKKRQPLTAAQQATVLQWRRLAMKYTRRLLYGYGLRQFEDEVSGLAAEALVEAVRVWVPSRGSFGSCLRWWVRRVLQSFRAHGARTVHQAVESSPRDFRPIFSLNKSLEFGPAESIGDTWQDVLRDDSTADPSEPVDSRRLLRAAYHLLPRAVAGRDPTKREMQRARESVHLWGARVLGDGEETLQELGDAAGLTREGVRQRILAVQTAFDAWAAELRREAA